MALLPGRKFFAGLVAGLPVGIVLTVLVSDWLSSKQSYDRIDRFEVLAVVKDPGSKASAVIVNYENGNSSAGGTALWVVETPAPAVGSTEPLMGPPDLVSTVPFSSDQVAWRPNHRVLLTLKTPVNVSADDHYCYWDEPPLPTICLSGPGVDVEVGR